ncbi:MAG: protein jag [Clostridia bacterium]|nr:protein jag [Clostridia bacterium]
MGNVVIEQSGKTVEEAISLALEQLDVTEEQVEIEILQESSSKGLLGIKKEKDAIIRVTLHDYSAEIANDFLSELMGKMGMEATINVEDSDEKLLVDIKTNKSGVIIGRHGETLDAIQFITSIVVNRNNPVYKKVIIDTEGYRVKREETLVVLANRLAKKAIDSKKSVSLEPMNPYERRIIHSTLQQNDKIETYSVGEEPHRKVVIKSIG